MYTMDHFLNVRVSIARDYELVHCVKHSIYLLVTVKHCVSAKITVSRRSLRIWRSARVRLLADN